MKLLTTIAVVTVLVAACDAGSKCKWGPSYWCKSPNTAKECGQETYCQQSVWMVKEKKVGGAVECEMCNLVVEEVEKLIETNTTKIDIEVAVKKLCKIIGPLNTACESMIDQYFDQIWGMVTKELDAKKVCEMIKMCAPSKSVQLAAAKPENVGDVCSICKEITGYLKMYVDASGSEAEAKVDMEDVCKMLEKLAPNISKECTDLVTKDFDLIWGLLKDEVDSDEICKQLGLCNTTLSLPHKTSLEGFGDECSICKEITGFLKMYVDASGSEAEAKGAVDAVCKVLPGNISMDCTDLVTKYFDVIWGLLKDEVDSDEICKQLGLCNTTLSLPHKTSLEGFGDECSICKEITGFLKMYVDASGSEAEAKGAVDAVCKVLPGNISMDCTDLVTKYFDVIWGLLKDEVDSDEICKQLGLCNTTLSLPHKVTNGGEECVLCKMIVDYLDMKVNKNSTEQEVKDALEEFCAKIKSTQCTSLITGYFDVVWELVKGEMNNDEFCKQTNMCPSFGRVSMSVPKVSLVCEVCEEVVSILKPFVDSNKTETEAKAEVEKYCSELPSYEDECTSLIDDYFDEIWKLLKSYFDDKDICSEVKLCNKSKVTVSLQSKLPQAGVECMMCKVVIEGLDKFLGDNASEAEIEAALDKACGLLPAFANSTCESFVNKYLKEIVKLIINDASPEEVCKAINVCTASVKLSSPKVSTPKTGVDCVLCEFVMKELDKLLKENSTEAEIEAALDDVCNVLPTTLKANCISFVNKYAVQIIEKLVSGVSPTAVCTAISLCTSVSKVSTPKAGVECTMCEFVMKELDGLLGKNSTEAEIEGALDKVCGVLPKTIQSECEEFLKDYTPNIIAALVNELDPKTVCTAISLCSNSSVRVASPKAGPVCALCDLVVEKLVSLMHLDGNNTKAAIEKELDEVCSRLSSSMKDECVTLVDKYTPKILALLLEGAVPKTICSLLHLCLFEQQPLVKNPKAVTECEVCKVTIGAIKDLIDSNASQKTVEWALEKVCSELPEISEECENMVKDYGAQIIQLLDKEIDAVSLCEDVKLCKKKSNKKAINLLMKPWLKMARTRGL